MRIEELIFRNYALLNNTDLFMWKYISAHKKECYSKSIDVLAKECNVSRTTITRFVKKLGLKGFSEFKVYLGWEVEEEGSYGDSAYEITCNSIISFVEDLKIKDYANICRLLYESNRIFVYGSGDIQSAVARQLKRMFLSCQEIVYDFAGTTFDNAFYDIVESTDVLILISLSGENNKIIEIAKKNKLAGAKIITITELRDSELAQISDEKLYISSTQLSFLHNHPMYKTTMLYFVLIELLFVKYSIYKKNRLLEEGANRKI